MTADHKHKCGINMQHEEQKLTVLQLCNACLRYNKLLISLLHCILHNKFAFALLETLSALTADHNPINFEVVGHTLKSTPKLRLFDNSLDDSTLLSCYC